MCNSSDNAKISSIALIAIVIIIKGIPAKRPRRIVGGENAASNEIPWMARLDITNGNGVNYDCGGAIISPRHILTAAHCLQNAILNSVWTGFYIRDLNFAVKSKPAKIIVHPHYKFHILNSSAYIENDVAIVTLDRDLKLHGNQNVILLADKKTTVGARAVLAGWGFTDESKKHKAMILQKTSIVIRPNDQCSINMPKQLCGSSPPYATPCDDDSGSPLVVDRRVVGILSTGWCLVGRETIYADVYHHLAWIRSVVEQTSVSNNSGREKLNKFT